MAVISKSALVMYSSSEMFQLVDDINAYGDFLPWCRSATVISRSDDEVKASIEIAKGALNKSFTTLNRLQKDKVIEMRLLEGPFKHLEGFWRFKSLNNNQACKISLDLSFEFESKILALAVGPVFNQIGNSMVDAFCKRAVEVYGERF